VTWSMIGLLATIAAGVDAREAEQSARAAAGETKSDDATDVAAEESTTQSDEELMFSFDVEALIPIVNGPAIQVLPLAICT
jgi:hypothetical protein